MMTEEKRATRQRDHEAQEASAQDERRPQPQDQRQEPHERAERQLPSRVGADAPLRSEELQQQILESVRPMLRDFQREIEQSVQQVRQSLTQPAQEGWPALATAGQQD